MLPAKMRLISQIHMFAFLLFHYEKLRIVFMARNHRGGSRRSLLCRKLMRSRDRRARTDDLLIVC